MPTMKDPVDLQLLFIEAPVVAPVGFVYRWRGRRRAHPPTEEAPGVVRPQNLPLMPAARQPDGHLHCTASDWRINGPRKRELIDI
jgi:hypothetical protein